MRKWFWHFFYSYFWPMVRGPKEVDGRQSLHVKERTCHCNRFRPGHVQGHLKDARWFAILVLRDLPPGKDQFIWSKISKLPKVNLAQQSSSWASITSVVSEVIACHDCVWSLHKLESKIILSIENKSVNPFKEILKIVLNVNSIIRVYQYGDRKNFRIVNQRWRQTVLQSRSIRN